MDIRKAWINHQVQMIKPLKKAEILPKDGETNILITSALPYVNNIPHLGNIIGSVLSADVFARFCRLKKRRCIFICGTDEYGTATETKALLEGVTPREICDKYHKIHKSIYDWFNIEFDHFGRTTTKHQTELTQEIFLKLHKNGFTSTDSIDQLNCISCQRFLADRFVYGQCPNCAFEDARGDQCDKCGKLINAVDLIKPRCNLCHSTPIVKQSTHIFLRLDKLANEVEEHMMKQLSFGKNQWSPNAISIAKSWLKNGLEKRCITRDLKWGVPVPLPDFANKVFYVWFDAPIGYMSITKDLLHENWTKWWKNAENVNLYNFVGKDNVAFHSVMFPATLLGARDNYTVINHLCATEYLNYENTKFSKSRGTGVFGDMAKETGIEADLWRFYLLYIRPENQDTSFAWDDFALKLNAELLNNLGNFINRALTFLVRSFNGIIPEMKLNDPEDTFLAEVASDLAEYDSLLTNVKLRDGISKVLSVSRRGNLYIQMSQPWVLIKGDENQRAQAATVIGVAVNVAYLLAIMLHPYMPVISKRIREQCGLTELFALPDTPISFLKAGHKIGVPKPLFTKIEKTMVDELKNKFAHKAEETSAEQKERRGDGSERKEGNVEWGAHQKIADMEGLPSAKAMSNRPCSNLIANQQEIDNLLETIVAKFEKKKNVFEMDRLRKLEERQTKLKAEIVMLKKDLIELEKTGGIRQVASSHERYDGKKLNAGEKAETKRLNGGTNKSGQVDSVTGVKFKHMGDSKQKNKGALKAVGAEAELSNEDVVDVGRLDLRIGRIIDVDKHPSADSLYIETIDLGEASPRIVISGLVRHVPKSEMQDRLVVCVCNLKPSKIRGIESQAMVLCASTPEKVELLSVDISCSPGQLVASERYKRRPDTVLNPKKKIWEQVAADLKVDSNGIAVYKNEALLIDGRFPLSAATLRNVPVK